MIIKLFRNEQVDYVAHMVKKLWPEHEINDLKRILIDYVKSNSSAVFSKIIDEKYVGVALCTLRYDYVEGCESSPVCYLEGIYVDEEYRMNGIAKNLCKECENWGRSKGCKEFASDCELTNDVSLNFHLNIGFKEENRIICFKKMLK